MRREMTLAEVVLWRELRGGKLGVRFRRQEPIGPYIVDFVCTSRHLVVEVDGDFHDDGPVDARRDAWLRGRQYRVLRFWNEDVVNGTDLVVDIIKSAVHGAPKDGRHQLL